jgi:hypothetical protein
MSKRTLDSSSRKSGSVRKSSRRDVDIDVAESVRRDMIAEGEYYRAERRGFAPGFEAEDWLESENELNARIQSGSLERVVLSGEKH